MENSQGMVKLWRSPLMRCAEDVCGWKVREENHYLNSLAIKHGSISKEATQSFTRLKEMLLSLHPLRYNVSNRRIATVFSIEN